MNNRPIFSYRIIGYEFLIIDAIQFYQRNKKSRKRQYNQLQQVPKNYCHVIWLVFKHSQVKAGCQQAEELKDITRKKSYIELTYACCRHENSH